MNTYHRPTNGFTLIELMIAISLGMLIVYVAAAAFRVASQSVTISNRLSLENAVMRAGFQLAHQEIDFWTSVDNPDDASRRRLRALTATGEGMPFTPFSRSWPSNNVLSAENAIGHNPRDTEWAVGNPRVWWRGNMAEKEDTELNFGRYGLFANTSGTLVSGQLYGNYNQIGEITTVAHSWIYNQFSDLTKALGYYGMCDYMPANAVYAAYGKYGNGTNQGGIPKWHINPGTDNGPTFNNRDGSQKTARGKYRQSYITSYAIINPQFTNNATTLNSLHRRNYSLGRTASSGTVATFESYTNIPDDFLPIRPANWPGLTVSVQRFIKNTHFVNVARVRCNNALTGEPVELTFTGFGTTLRGARQQRKDDVNGGWATWDNVNTPDMKTLDKTLDNY